MKKLVFVLLTFIHCSLIFANGGITTYSSVTGTGDPVFINMPDVKLLSEKLTIRLEHAYSRVHVKYILWNSSNKDFNQLDYGFPIDYEVGERDGPPAEWKDTYLKDIAFRAEGKNLTYTHTPEKLHNAERGIYRKWYYTQLSIKKRSFLILEVEYAVENSYVVDGHSPLNLADLEGGFAYLSYDFSPAASWGDGIIRDFYLDVDASAIQLSGMYASYPYYSKKDYESDYDENYDYSKTVYSKGLDLKQEGSHYTCRIRNFDLKKANPLEISYSYTPSLEFVSSYLLAGGYTVSVSGAAAGYPKSNLSDMNLETAWVPAKKGGIGEWMEFTFLPNTTISGFTLVNGYHKSEAIYQGNNRIKKIKLEIKDTGSEERRSFDVDFADAPYEPVYFETLISKAGWVDFFDYSCYGSYYGYGESCYVEKVKLTILEVYPGTKYNDTCVSEIVWFK